jgi:acetyl esterase/lipase
MNLSSHRLHRDGRFGLSEAQMRWFWNLYAPHLPPEERARRLSPLTTDLSGFPPTLCIGAECHLLLDDTLSNMSRVAAAETTH